MTQGCSCLIRSAGPSHASSCTKYFQHILAVLCDLNRAEPLLLNFCIYTCPAFSIFFFFFFFLLDYDLQLHDQSPPPESFRNSTTTSLHPTTHIHRSPSTSTYAFRSTSYSLSPIHPSIKHPRLPSACANIGTPFVRSVTSVGNPRNTIRNRSVMQERQMVTARSRQSIGITIMPGDALNTKCKRDLPASAALVLTLYANLQVTCISCQDRWQTLHPAERLDTHGIKLCWVILRVIRALVW